MKSAKIVTINGGDAAITVVKPGPHRAKRIVRAIESDHVSAVVLAVDSPGGPLASMPDPPVVVRARM